MNKLKQIWQIQELRNSIVFVISMLVLFRAVAHIPVPGVDILGLRQFFAGNQVLGMLNVFSGGVMENFSIVMMGVAPYITASIIFQLLAMVIPAMEEMQKEESGRQKINSWTRITTVPFAALQAFGMISLMRNSGYGILGDLSVWNYVTIITTITAGTVFLMWIGELISERKIGNGISILIFAGIIASLPQSVQQAFLTFDKSQIIVWGLFLAVAVATIWGVVRITEGQRNIPVQYARAGSGVNTFLPIRVNIAGVIPIIFAISVILFPTMIAQFFVHAKTAWIANAAEFTVRLFADQLFYGILYFVLVFAFTFFYSEVVFRPERIAENLQKQGGFIPGIRPGAETIGYLRKISYRVVFVGALFLSSIAVLPLILQYFTGYQFLAIGGTSLLIVVSVVIDIVRQIEAQLTMRKY